MIARAKIVAAAPIRSPEERVGAYDWNALATELGSYGCAVLEKLLTPKE